MMCEEQHKLHPSHQLLFPKKSLRDIDIPPRKLLGRGRHCGSAADEEALLRRFLPSNNDDEDDDPYASEQFRMYEFKVRRCTRSRSHDWTDCPFAHPGEKARRRDPRRYHYSGTVCPDFRRGSCGKGDNCEFAHGVFECWLHPARYRTEACKDGKNCKRKVCFFAHTPRQLRLLPPTSDSPSSSPRDNQKFVNHHCCSCVYCHHSAASPTSTLLNMSNFSPPLSPSQSLSPPLSPATPYSPVSRFSKFGGLTYKEALTDLMSSIEGLSVSEGHNPMASDNYYNRSSLSWVDVNGFNGGDDQSQSQFVLSPAPGLGARGVGEFSMNGFGVEDNRDRVGESGLSCPDFGWVNDLLT